MTCKIKRRSLRCGGRPKADFGSLFTSVIAPTLSAAGSIADESISNNKTTTNGVVNNNTTIPSDPTKTPTMRLGGRKKCWIGAAIGAATSIAGSLFGNGAKKREMRRQKSIQDWQNTTQEAANMTTALNNSQDYQEDYLRQFRTAARLGKTLGAKGIYITDGGDATKIGNNTYLLRGGSHEDVNETGQTGIGINVGGNEVEAEGGEVAQKKNGALRIFSAQPILSNGMSPAQAILRGYNKDSVFKQQQAFKKRNGLKDDGSKARRGTEVPYKRIHINEDGTFTDTLTGKNYNTSATNGVDKMKGDDELFIPREYNRFDDFIREARIFMKPRRTYDSEKNRKFIRELEDRMWARSRYRNQLVDMSRRLRRRNEKHYTFFDVNKRVPMMNFDEPFRFGGRCKFGNGGLTSIYDAPNYDSDYNGGNVLGNGEVTVTAKRIKPTFMKPNNDAMNIINHPANETPYVPQRHNRSRTIFSGGDYLGLGIDTLAALSTGLVNYNTAGKYVLPDRAPIIQASKLPTTYNVNPEIEEVKRYRDRLTGQTFNNTSSSVAALNRSGAINLDALSNLSKLWATKENEENKMLTKDAKNQQTVAAQNVQNELARQSEIARIKNEATQAKGDALNIGLSGLSQAWTNFWTAGRTAYEDDQTRRAMIASSKDATPTSLMEMDFDLSPDVIAALYRTTNDDRTKRFYLSRLSPKQRQKYGIN